jgi:hypothetical protein
MLYFLYFCHSRLHLRLVRNILITRYIPKPANTQRISPATILCSTIFLNAKTSVRPVYENTITGRYLLTFSVIPISSVISFIRSAVVTGNYPRS